MNIPEQLKFLDLPAPEACALKVEPLDDVADEKTLRAVVSQWLERGASGWCQHTDQVIAIGPGQPPTTTPILALELSVESDQETLAARFADRGCVAIRLCRLDGDTHWAIRRELRGVLPGDTPSAGATAVYEVFWPATLASDALAEMPCPVIGPEASRFVALQKHGAGGE